MNKQMKLLVAYDGSKSSESAIDDLALAGLPETGEALVVSVAEMMAPPDVTRSDGEAEVPTDPLLQRVFAHRLEKCQKAITEARTFAGHAQNRLRNILPGWEITTEAVYGSPAWELLDIADKYDPDLIIVGSQGQSALSRVLLGSISQSILTKAHCSVRVGRGKIELDRGPVRILIGFDGSQGAKFAVDEVASRNWPQGSEVCLLSAVDHLVPASIGRFVTPVTGWAKEEFHSELEWVKVMASNSLIRLEGAGLKSTLQVLEGNPKQLLTDEAWIWQADSIFVGANAHGGGLGEMIIGTVSSAVAARAHCSVEVVRRNAGPQES